jgi:hypothetical protein
MNNTNPALVSDLQRSLDSVRKLSKSSRSSIVLMLIGFFVIGASLIYSVTRLRPLEQQIAQKQGEIQKKTAALQELEGKITAANQELADTNDKLAVARNALATTKESLSKIAGGQKDPAAEARRTLQIVSSASDIVNTPGPPILTPSNTGQTLTGTTWNYAKGPVHYVIKFLPSGKFRYQNERGQWFDGLWKQTGSRVNIVTSNGSERETGTINGNRIQGRGQDEFGGTWTWTATKSN